MEFIEKHARLAIESFLNGIEADVVDGITYQGADKSFDYVAISRFSPPNKPGIFLSVYTNGVELEVSNSGGFIGDWNLIYPMTIEMADVLLPQSTDEHAYEQMTLDFLIMRDRILDALYDKAKPSETFSSGGYEFSIVIPDNGTLFRVRNVEELTLRKSPLMLSVITFDLRTCGRSS